MLTGIKLVQNTHCSLQCWYRTSVVFRRKNANRNQTARKYTLLLTNYAGIEAVCRYSQEKQMLREIKLVQK